MTEDIQLACPIHLSLIRPILLGGADRNLVMINITCIALLIFGVGLHWATIISAAILAVFGHLILVKIAKIDPLCFQVYLRHIKYRDYYLAKGYYV